MGPGKPCRPEITDSTQELDLFLKFKHEVCSVGYVFSISPQLQDSMLFHSYLVKSVLLVCLRVGASWAGGTTCNVLILKIDKLRLSWS